MSKNLSNKTAEFIEKSLKIHGNKFDYSKVVYSKGHTKVTIICPEHGEFLQSPSNHLSGKECIKCSYKKRGLKMVLDKEQFIEKSIKIHGDTYDYSKVDYLNSKTKVSIICSEIDKITGEKHNVFWQTPYSHLNGATCPKCSKHYLNNDIFLKRAKVLHNNKYDYSKVEYKAAKEKVCIICKDHGEFNQTPDSHLNGQGCPKCSKVYRYSTNEWIEESKKIHADRYDYSNVEYINNSTKIRIVCKEHGEFWQTPANHLKGKNCPKCTGHFMDEDFFLDKAKDVYKDNNGNPLYDYSLVNYIDSSTYVTIICHKIDPKSGKQHGEFSKTPNKHLSGQGCPLCGNESGGIKNRLTNEEFIKKAFHERFEYLTEYVTAKTKIHIKCKKCGHKFWQQASSHLSGCGCPFCNESRLEKEVTNFLISKGVNHEKQKKFDWLGRQSLDFFLPDYNIAIECQGIQHFEPIDFFGGESSLAEIVKRDNRKLSKCLSNNLKMIYVIDNEKYFEKQYHFYNVEPFSDNVIYKIIHIKYLENYIIHLIDTSQF